MTKIEEIEAAIAQLPREQFEQLAEWFGRQRETDFDRQVEADAKAGRLDPLWAKAEQEIAQGKARPLDELLDN
jgi:hypothetical protein